MEFMGKTFKYDLLIFDLVWKPKCSGVVFYDPEIPEIVAPGKFPKRKFVSSLRRDMIDIKIDADKLSNQILFESEGAILVVKKMAPAALECGMGRLSGLLYVDGLITDVAYGDSIDNIVSELLILDMNKVSKFPETFRVGVMETLLGSFEKKLVVFVDDYTLGNTLRDKVANVSYAADKIAIVSKWTPYGNILYGLYRNDNKKFFEIKTSNDKTTSLVQYNFPNPNPTGPHSNTYVQELLNTILYTGKEVLESR